MAKLKALEQEVATVAPRQADNDDIDLLLEAVNGLIKASDDPETRKSIRDDVR